MGRYAFNPLTPAEKSEVFFCWEQRATEKECYMLFYSLLEVSEQTTNLVKWISVGAVVVLLLLVFLISSLSKKKENAKRLAFAGICASMSFTLAIIKFSPVFGRLGARTSQLYRRPVYPHPRDLFIRLYSCVCRCGLYGLFR